MSQFPLNRVAKNADVDGVSVIVPEIAVSDNLFNENCFRAGRKLPGEVEEIVIMQVGHFYGHSGNHFGDVLFLDVVDVSSCENQ